MIHASGIVVALMGAVVFVSLPRALAAPAKGESASPPSATAAAKSGDGPLASNGVVEGVITFRGQIPKSSVADDAGVHRDLLHVDRESAGLRSVVVWLVMGEFPKGERRSPASPASEAATPPLLMDQRDHEFVPRVLAVRSGQPVKFTNSDPANHNVRTSSSQRTNEFNVFTGVDGSYTHRFAADPRSRPVRVGCDIHPWMRGWIYVFDQPYFAVSDARGRFRIASVPPGRYRMMLRQPDIRYIAEREVTVAAGRVARIDVEVTMSKDSAPEE